MHYKIKKDVDPIFEIMGLCYLCNPNINLANTTIDSLNQLGFNGEKIYHSKFRYLETYTQTFFKYKKTNDTFDFFFMHDKDTFFLFIVSIICSHREWLSLDQLDENEINIAIIDALKDTLETNEGISIDSIDEVFNLLNNSEFDEGERWKIMTLLQKPLELMTGLLELIKINEKAFEKATQSIIKEQEHLLHNFSIFLDKNSDTHLDTMQGVLTKGSNVYPSLVTPASKVFFYESCYYGVLIEAVFHQTSYHEKITGQLLMKLKSICDKSKLQILCSLKEKPKYNLEIAEELGLSAGTMSHHMNSLLASEFVRVDKVGGKVYYYLEEDNIKELLDTIALLLL